MQYPWKVQKEGTIPSEFKECQKLIHYIGQVNWKRKIPYLYLSARWLLLSMAALFKLKNKYKKKSKNLKNEKTSCLGLCWAMLSTIQNEGFLFNS